MASKSGYGIAHMPAMVFEVSGFASNPRMAEAMKEVRQRFGTERMLRLVEDFP